jgi:hypothetical protein
MYQAVMVALLKALGGRGSLPFLYGGDMIAEGQVFPDRVGYNCLPWKYAAGTPNILGAVVSAQAVRLLVDLALSPRRPVYFGTDKPLDPAAPPWPTTASAWTRPPAAGSASTSTTPPPRSTRPSPPSPPSPPATHPRSRGTGACADRPARRS